ncbi:AraC-type DNA-binding protein [Paenibacillus sp. UNC496MF]|uniref:AraC family transcriptional regulator n=1 Tax=Paenibacillus sp. UNC496MF TaxID=1502753 RepID=UPI0008E0A6B8|nr:AraC family transcriptional regulator [Paenibacillus sp. UNC496MF]SFJ93772.1 AraC-type DNA-binding protein [Paenibacillus sp. UNC496MF]
MSDRLGSLLRHAELQIVEFDIHRRIEMNTFNRTLPWYVMSYLKSDSAKLRISGDVTTIAPGTVTFIPPNVEHDHYKDTPDEAEFLWWHFTYEIAGVMDAMKMFQIPYVFRLQNNEFFEKVFMEFMESADAGMSSLPLSILTQAKSLELLYIILNSAVGQSDAHADVAKSECFLDMLSRIFHSPEEPLTLRMMSDELHLHPTYVSNRFKELFGKPPMQVQREMRIQKAKALLESSELSVTEISQRLGYSELQNFTRLFKSYVGISPTQFRELNRKWRVMK